MSSGGEAVRRDLECQPFRPQEQASWYEGATGPNGVWIKPLVAWGMGLGW